MYQLCTLQWLSVRACFSIDISSALLLPFHDTERLKCCFFTINIVAKLPLVCVQVVAQAIDKHLCG